MPEPILALEAVTLVAPEGRDVFRNLDWKLDRGARFHARGGAGGGCTALLRLCAALAWCVAANRDDNFIAALDTHVFRDSAGVMGRLAHDLGNAYQKPGKLHSNASELFQVINNDQFDPLPGLTESRKFVAAVLEPLATARIQRADAAVIRDEFANAGRMLRYACDRGQAAPAPQLASQLREIIAEHRRLWLTRNRPGGLSDSCRVLEKRLSEAERG